LPRRTLEHPVELKGLGLHTGCDVVVRCCPGPAGEGIVFRRVDLPGHPAIPARLDWVSATTRRTRLGRDDVMVETVEHLLAVVQARGIDDLLVEINGPELPILDGSFAPWADALEVGGGADQSGEPLCLSVERSFEIREGESSYRVTTCDRLEVQATIEWAHPLIGRQSAALEVSAAAFGREIARARTFGFASELEGLRAAGLLRGATLASAIVLSEEGILTGPVRWPNEFARHKLGDLIGDLALLGGRLAARIVAERPSHRGNVALARAIATQNQPEREA
jgi:UDP-3-O-acyl N-acetylglucosamine deacetylase